MDADSIRWGRRGEWWESASAVVRVEEKGERGGTEDPRGGGAEEMENFFAPSTSDSTGVTGGQEILPFSVLSRPFLFPTTPSPSPGSPSPLPSGSR